MSIKSINQPAGVQMTTVLPNSVNQPAPLPEGPPVIEGLNPSTAAADGASRLMVVHGKNFMDGAVIMFGTVALDTNFESASKLNAYIPGWEVGEYLVTVMVGPYSSEPRTFTFTSKSEPEPEADLADPDEMEDELEQAKEEGDFAPTHRGRATPNKKGKR